MSPEREIDLGVAKRPRQCVKVRFPREYTLATSHLRPSGVERPVLLSSCVKMRSSSRCEPERNRLKSATCSSHNSRTRVCASWTSRVETKQRTLKLTPLSLHRHSPSLIQHGAVRAALDSAQHLQAMRDPAPQLYDVDTEERDPLPALDHPAVSTHQAAPAMAAHATLLVQQQAVIQDSGRS